MTEIDKSLWPPTCHGRWMSEEYEPGLVSVIIPTYNRAHFLVEAMDSVRAQTYRPVELIVVDDGSMDATPQVVEQWSRSRADEGGFTFRYFRQQQSGAPAARNRGLTECHGEFVLFLDSDDRIGRRKIAASVARLRGAAALSAVQGPWRCLYSRPAPGCGPLMPPDVFDSEDGRLHAYIGGASCTPTCAYVFRREVACAVGPWDEELRQRQDTDYVVRAIMAGTRFVQEHDSVAYYRRHGQQHIGHAANFRRHFPSLLALADKWHRFLRDGALPPDVRPALRAGLLQLLMEARVAGYAAGIARCRRRLKEWFGEDADRSRLAGRVIARRALLRPLRRLVGEMPMEYAKQLLRGRWGLRQSPAPRAKAG